MNKVQQMDPVFESGQGEVFGMAQWMSRLGAGTQKVAKTMTGIGVVVTLLSAYQKEFTDGPAKGRSAIDDFVRGTFRGGFELGGAYGGGLALATAGGVAGEVIDPAGGGIPLGIIGAVGGALGGQALGDLVFDTFFP